MIDYFKQTLCLIIVYCLLVITFSSPVRAESLSVSLRVGDTRVQFTGYSSPSAFITITQNSVVVGTTVADAAGNWDKTIVVDDGGIQSFELSTLDTNSILAPTLSYNVNLSDNSITTISNIVIPPTISASGLTLSGTTHPLSTLTLMISDGSTHSVSVTPNGVWSYAVSINTPGTYSAYLTATIPGNYISLASHSVSFVVTPSTTTVSSTPIPSPLPSPSPTTTKIFKTKHNTEKLSPSPTSDSINVATQQSVATKPIKTITIITFILALLSPIRTFFIFLFNKLRAIPFFTFLIFRNKKKNK